MKSSGVLALAAAVAGAHASNHYARHEQFHARGMYDAAPAVPSDSASCGCTTIWSTIYGSPTLMHPTSVPETYISAPQSSVPIATSTVVVVPTAEVTTCPTTGVYTFPATTLTVTEETTVCEATSTQVPAGTHTVGGVITVVETSTQVVCPYATTTSVNGQVTSTILTTTYVCPSAGTYTIAPLTTTCSESIIWVYPTAAYFTTGEYTRPANTITVTETDYTYVCPFAAPATSAPAASSPPETPAQPSSTPNSQPKPSNPGSSTALGNPGGEQWAMTYTPYTASGQCKSAGDVMTDIAALAAAGFSTCRLYSTDCSGLENVGAACKAAGIKMIIGVFIEASGISVAQEQVTAIISWGQWELVELIVLGNEAVFNGYCSASDLAAFITSSKSSFSGAGYSGPCTTTETVDVWQANSEVLCAVVDIVAFQGHPFYNANTDAASAGTFVESQFAIMNALCPGKSESYNLECGWPSAGECNGLACPGKSEQSTAIEAIKGAAGGITVIMSTYDDTWKPAGQFGEDQHWGALHCYD